MLLHLFNRNVTPLSALIPFMLTSVKQAGISKCGLANMFWTPSSTSWNCEFVMNIVSEFQSKTSAFTGIHHIYSVLSELLDTNFLLLAAPMSTTACFNFSIMRVHWLLFHVEISSQLRSNSKIFASGRLKMQTIHSERSYKLSCPGILPLHIFSYFEIPKMSHLWIANSYHNSLSLYHIRSQCPHLLCFVCVFVLFFFNLQLFMQ